MSNKKNTTAAANTEAAAATQNQVEQVDQVNTAGEAPTPASDEPAEAPKPVPAPESPKAKKEKAGNKKTAAPSADKPAAETKKANKAALQSSVSIGKKVENLSFLRFTHPDGRILQWKLASVAEINADGDRFTPQQLHDDQSPARLLAFEAKHPIYFEEIFE